MQVWEFGKLRIAILIICVYDLTYELRIDMAFWAMRVSFIQEKI